MEKQVIMREFKDKNVPALTAIIKDAWKYDELCSSKVANKLATVFLYSCLTNQTYTKVCLIDGVPAGIIMGKNIKNHKCNFKYRMKLLQSIIMLFLSKEGRRTAKIFKSVSDIDKQLLADCNKKYQGELAFFAVNSKMRGIGIGKKLFHELLNYMKSQDIKDFYLFTDTSCNYGFYEHQGMIRRKEKKHCFMIENRQRDMNFFIYDYEIK